MHLVISARSVAAADELCVNLMQHAPGFSRASLLFAAVLAFFNLMISFFKSVQPALGYSPFVIDRLSRAPFRFARLQVSNVGRPNLESQA